MNLDLITVLFILINIYYFVKLLLNSMKMSKIISIIIPCYNEENYIEECLTSILNNDFLDYNYELIIVDGQSSDKTVDIIKNMISSNDRIILLNNPKRIASSAMNIGIRKSIGDIIFRMDVHAIYPVNYIAELLCNMDKYNADNIGCVIDTVPYNSTNKSFIIAKAISHPFGVGNSFFRIGINNVKEVDTVPFGCFKRNVFEQIGLFDEDLVRNQDDEFNARMRKNGMKIFLIPSVRVKYYARDKYMKLFRMYFQYGLYKPLVNKKIGLPATMRQLIPLFFVLFLLFGLIFSLLSEEVLIIYLTIILIYFLINILVSLRILIRNKRNILRNISGFIYSFFLIHFSYGIGYIKGLIYFTLIRRKNNNIIKTSR